MFLDSDDVIGPDTIASQVEFLTKNPNSMIAVCRNRLFTSLTAKGRPEIVGRWELFKKNLGVHLCYFNIAPPHAFFFRRETVIQAGWFDPNLKACEDYDFWLRTSVNGNIPQYNPKGLVYYRRHVQSMSANHTNQFLHDAIMHNRLSGLLDQYPHFPDNRRLEAYLAFSAGALVTAARLHNLNNAGAHDLVSVAFKRIVDANNIARSGKSDWNILTKLFCLRIILFLTYPCFKDSQLKERIHENVLDIMKVLKAPSFTPFFIADLLSEIFFGSPKYINERIILVKLLKDLNCRLLKKSLI